MGKITLNEKCFFWMKLIYTFWNKWQTLTICRQSCRSIKKARPRPRGRLNARICVPHERDIGNFDRANNDPRHRRYHDLARRDITVLSWKFQWDVYLVWLGLAADKMGRPRKWIAGVHAVLFLTRYPTSVCISDKFDLVKFRTRTDKLQRNSIRKANYIDRNEWAVCCVNVYLEIHNRTLTYFRKLHVYTVMPFSRN